MPNLEGRTAPPAGRAILSVLRCVTDEEGSLMAIVAWVTASSASSAGAVSGLIAVLVAPGMSIGRLMRIVFIGAFAFLTGAAPIASASEIRAVLCLAASF